MISRGSATLSQQLLILSAQHTVGIGVQIALTLYPWCLRWQILLLLRILLMMLLSLCLMVLIANIGHRMTMEQAVRLLLWLFLALLQMLLGLLLSV